MVKFRLRIVFSKRVKIEIQLFMGSRALTVLKIIPSKSLSFCFNRFVFFLFLFFFIIIISKILDQQNNVEKIWLYIVWMYVLIKGFLLHIYFSERYYTETTFWPYLFHYDCMTLYFIEVEKFHDVSRINIYAGRNQASPVTCSFRYKR